MGPRPICGARLVHGMRRAGGERGVGIPRRHCGADAAISHGGRAHRQRPVIRVRPQRRHPGIGFWRRMNPMRGWHCA